MSIILVITLAKHLVALVREGGPMILSKETQFSKRLKWIMAIINGTPKGVRKRGPNY